jgi:hypothetical protein
VLASDVMQDSEPPATDRARVPKLVDEQSGQQENRMSDPMLCGNARPPLSTGLVCLRLVVTKPFKVKIKVMPLM